MMAASTIFVVRGCDSIHRAIAFRHSTQRRTSKTNESVRRSQSRAALCVRCVCRVMGQLGHELFPRLGSASPSSLRAHASV